MIFISILKSQDYDENFSAFFGLKKRSSSQFREERVHRLLVPALFLSLTSSYFLAIDFYGKLSPNCEEFSQWQNIRDRPADCHSVTGSYFLTWEPRNSEVDNLWSLSQCEEWDRHGLATLRDVLSLQKQWELRRSSEAIFQPSPLSQSRLVPLLSLRVFPDICRTLRSGSSWPRGWKRK